MRKQKLKIILKLGILIFGISVTLTNCQNDDESVLDESQLEQKTPLVVNQKIPFDKTIHFSKLKTKVNKIKNKLNV